MDSPLCRQVAVVSSDASASDLSPITGILTFPPGMTVETVKIESLVDSIPEPSELFHVQLVDIGNMGKIDGNTDTSLLTSK